MSIPPGSLVALKRLLHDGETIAVPLEALPAGRLVSCGRHRRIVFGPSGQKRWFVFGRG